MKLDNKFYVLDTNSFASDEDGNPDEDANQADNTNIDAVDDSDTTIDNTTSDDEAVDELTNLRRYMQYVNAAD